MAELALAPQPRRSARPRTPRAGRRRGWYRTAGGAAAGTVLAPLAVLLAGVHAVVRRPSLLVAATVVLDCVPSGRGDVAAPVHVTPADLAALALAAVVGVRAAAGHQPLVRRGWVPFAAVLLALTLATLTARDMPLSVTGLVRYAELFVLIPVAVAAAVQDRRDLAVVCAAVLGVSVVEGAVGAWQFVTRTGASFGGQPIRAYGTFGALDIMGMAVVVGFGIVVALALGLALSGRARVVLLAGAALLTAPLALSLSRGTWIATGCAVAAAALAAGWRVAVRGAALVVALAVILLGGLGVGSQPLAQRAGTIAPSAGWEDRSVADRYGLWRTPGAMWADHPVTGVG